MRCILVCAMMTLRVGVATAQPVQWRVADGGNGYWYEVDVTFRTWDEATSVADRIPAGDCLKGTASNADRAIAFAAESCFSP